MQLIFTEYSLHKFELRSNTATYSIHRSKKDGDMLIFPEFIAGIK